MPRNIKEFQEEQIRTLRYFLNPALFEFLQEHQDEPVEEVVKHFAFGHKNHKDAKPQRRNAHSRCRSTQTFLPAGP